MYDKFNYEFRKKSEEIKFNKVLLLITLLVASVLNFVLLFLNVKYFYLIIPMTLLSIVIIYLLIFLYYSKRINDGNLSNIKKIKSNISYIQNFCHEKDKSLLKKLLSQNNINTKTKLKEAMNHYQQERHNQKKSIDLLSLFSLMISIIGVIFSLIETNHELMLRVFVALLLLSLFCFLITSFIKINIINLFSMNRINKMIYSEISEIFYSMKNKKK